MGLLMWLFGVKGKVRFDFTTIDNKSFSGTVPITLLNDVNESEVAEKLKDALFVETGKQIKDVKITGFYEY